VVIDYIQQNPSFKDYICTVYRDISLPLMNWYLYGRVHHSMLINHTLKRPSPVHILFLHFDSVGEFIFHRELEN
jgi:hypothetical protein